MSDNTRELFQNVYQMIQAGKKAEAMTLLNPVIEADPDNAEGWWLMAHAVESPDESLIALQRVLQLKPNYPPAKEAYFQQQLAKAEVLIKGGRTTEVMELLRHLLRDSPDNIDVLWLMARASPIAADQISICQQILKLKPDHEQARQMIAAKKTHLFTANTQKKLRKEQPSAGRTRPWMLFALLGVLAIVGTGIFVVYLLTGNSFAGLIPKPAKVKTDLGQIGNSAAPAVKIDTLAVGATHDYGFDAQPNSLFLGLVNFTTSSGNPGKAVQLLDSSGKVVASADVAGQGGRGTAFIQATLTTGGHYVLELTGTEGIAQGAYTVQMGVQSADGS